MTVASIFGVARSQLTIRLAAAQGPACASAVGQEAPGTDGVKVVVEARAISAVDGATRWTYQVGARIMSSPAVSGDGRAVAFGAGNGVLYAASADTGKALSDDPIPPNLRHFQPPLNEPPQNP